LNTGQTKNDHRGCKFKQRADKAEIILNTCRANRLNREWTKLNTQQAIIIIEPKELNKEQKRLNTLQTSLKGEIKGTVSPI
jgi:hypothetical protein